MKITRYLVASSAVAFALLVASPALADSQISLNGSARDNTHAGLHIGSIVRLSDDHDTFVGSQGMGEENGDQDEQASVRTTNATKVTITGAVSAVSGSTITLAGNNGTTYTVDAAGASVSNRDTVVAMSDIKIGDRLVVKGTHSGSVITASKIRDISFMERAFLSAIGAADAGVVTSVGSSSFTLKPFGARATTSVTTNASTTYTVNGVATTSSALAAGSRAIVFGTTDSSGGITASLVSILNFSLGFFMHLFR